ncbi:MAG: hypothetical protein LBT17_01770 [Mycoplasmataceae bacterium]|jgi:hypothetical protein|nr:hypothetical protein [Mycoplasmataceae bacterium]
MENLINHIKELLTKNLEVDIVSCLQAINKILLTEYVLKTNNISIVPTEVEAYYWKKYAWEDKSVHRNELQKNNFGKFYFHRWCQCKLGELKPKNMRGIDLCLSYNDFFFLAVLIRSAIIDGETVFGPGRIFMKICDRANEDDFVLFKADEVRKGIVYNHGRIIKDNYFDDVINNKPIETLPLNSIIDIDNNLHEFYRNGRKEAIKNGSWREYEKIKKLDLMANKNCP